MKSIIISVIFLSSAGELLSGCSKSHDKDSEEVKKLQHQVAEMKAQQNALVPTPLPTSAVLTETDLSGLVFYRVKSGESVTLNASQVYLLTPSMARPTGAELKADHLTLNDSLDYVVALNKPLWSFDHYNDLEIAELEKPARRTPFQCTTDVAGRYIFKKIDPGEYYLFTTINTTKAVGFWYQKIKVPANQSTIFDLNNSNITAVATPSE